MVRRIEIELGPDRVWEIVTGALGDWLGGDIEIDLRPGGKIDFRATQRREGVVEEFEPGRRLTWRWWEAGDEDGATDTVVELAIAETDRGSRPHHHRDKVAGLDLGADRDDLDRPAAHTIPVGSSPSPVDECRGSLLGAGRSHQAAGLQRVAEQGDVTATELAAGLPVSRQAVSKHLDALGAAGLILARRWAVRSSIGLRPSRSPGRCAGCSKSARSGTSG